MFFALNSLLLRPMRKIFLLFLLTFTVLLAQSQNIGGVINSYASVSAINFNVLTVNTTSGFAVGDKILIIRMKGATIDQTNSPAYGDTISMNEAGKYTFSYIIALTNNTMTLSPFCDIFGSADFLQVVTVPIYPNPTITSTLTCQQWNGSTGGILIFETPGTLTMNADINVSGLGYRGGDVWGSTFNCGSTGYFSAQAFFGPEGKKGEGVAEYIVGQECGRGKLANGGGGAFAGNAGAGGGGNAGAGGNGGYQYSGCGATAVFGYGGIPIQHIPTRLFMGGGGGGPQADNAQQVYNGGNGGGIVFIRANQIDANGFNIEATGESTPQINDEGAPAGGAAGSVYLVCPNYSGSMNIFAAGGNGSSNFNTIFQSMCHGPGGGGGGGLVWFSTATTPVNVNVFTQGGQAGMVLNPLSPCFNTTYNAQPGQSGLTLYNFVPTDPPIPPTINLGNDTLICAGATLDLDAGTGFANYMWDNLFTGQIRTVDTVGTYYVTVFTLQGCTASDTISVFLDTSVVAAFVPDIRLGCVDDTVHFINNSLGSTQFLWIFGDGGTSADPNPTYVYQNQGIYNVTLISGNPPCFDTVSTTIDLRHPLKAGIEVNQDSLCIPENLVVNANLSLPSPILFPGVFQCEWIWGDGTPNSTGVTNSHFYTTPGTYTLTLIITDTLGCSDTAYYQIYVEQQPAVAFTISQTPVCVGEPIIFTQTTTSNINSWTWYFGDGEVAVNELNPTHTYSDAGNYTVRFTGDFFACSTDTLDVAQNVVVNPYPQVNLGADTALCPGLTNSILLADINNSAAIYRWSNGSIANSITVSEPGLYWVEATTPGSTCSTVDSIFIARDCYINIPNVFSPDGDGLNDFFLPREILSAGLKSFRMILFNRWGEKIFETNSIDGRGWDGKYNGVPQPMGVYVYSIDVEFINNIRKSFQGNVTLVR